jgi:hypothetical protein
MNRCCHWQPQKHWRTSLAMADTRPQAAKSPDFVATFWCTPAMDIFCGGFFK